MNLQLVIDFRHQIGYFKIFVQFIFQVGETFCLRLPVWVVVKHTTICKIVPNVGAVMPVFVDYRGFTSRLINNVCIKDHCTNSNRDRKLSYTGNICLYSLACCCSVRILFEYELAMLFACLLGKPCLDSKLRIIDLVLLNNSIIVPKLKRDDSLSSTSPGPI